MNRVIKNIDVLIVLDVLGALSSDSLEDNIYFIDSNGYLASFQNKAPFLTACSSGNTVTWRVRPLDPSDSVSIAFNGAMTERKVCVPRQIIVAGSAVWRGLVNQSWIPGDVGYSLTFKTDDKELSLNAYLKLPFN